MKQDKFPYRLKTQAVLAKRVKDLQLDGYSVIIQRIDISFTFYKLKHLSNGNVITITASPIDDFMTQKTNGIITYSGKCQ